MPNSDLFRLHEALEDVEEQHSYERFGLRANPFPPDGLAPDDNLLPSSPETLDAIGEFVRQFLRTRKYRGMVVLGTYGTGKTHTLKLIREQLQESGLPLKAIYLITPSYEPYQILRGILRELGQGEVIKMLWNVVMEDLTAKYDKEGVDFFGQFEPRVQSRTTRGRTSAAVTSQPPLFTRRLLAPASLGDYRTFLEAFDRDSLSRDALREYIVSIFKDKITPDLSIAGEFASMLIHDQYQAFASWESLTVPGRNRTLFKPDGEPILLLALMQVLKANGIQYLIILVDEFEGISLMKRMTRRDAVHYLYTLRMLIDRAWDEHPFAFVLASTRQAWDTAKGDLYEAFSDRVAEELELPRLNNEQTRQMMINYLDTARNSDEARGTLSPFDDDFFTVVGQERRNTPRQLVRLCYQLIERAVENGSDRIDASFLREYVPTITPDPEKDE